MKFQMPDFYTVVRYLSPSNGTLNIDFARAACCFTFYKKYFDRSCIYFEEFAIARCFI